MWETDNNALIVIDYTYDFVADDGKLTCGKPGQEIEEKIMELLKQNRAEYVVLAVDKHEENDNYHPENSLFPPHNIAGTKGRELYGELKEWYEKNQDREHVYWMDKTRYSAFAGTDLEQRLRARGIDTVELVGVCTDICVFHTAVDAYNKGFKIVIHEQAVASFDPAGHEYAMRHFIGSMGAKIL